VPLAASPRPDAGHSSQLALIEQAVAAALDIPAGALRRRSRGPAAAALGRQVVMYLAHVAFSISMQRLARLYGRDRATVAHACRLVEDCRDDFVFDKVLELIEVNCAGPPGAAAHVGAPKSHAPMIATQSALEWPQHA
jgi:hypothetical protein